MLIRAKFTRFTYDKIRKKEASFDDSFFNQLSYRQFK